MNRTKQIADAPLVGRAWCLSGAPRAIVGYQTDGSTADTVSAEADLAAAARDSLDRSGLSIVELAPHTESLGQANVVFTGSDGSITAASDPRSDGAAIVAHYPRHREIY